MILGLILFLHVINSCKISNYDAQSAYNRAKTLDCKEKIKQVSCSLEDGQLFDYTKLYERKCPNTKAIFLGYLKNNVNFTVNKTFSVQLNDECIGKCLSWSYKYAIYHGNNCYCSINESLEMSKDNQQGSNSHEVYDTGLLPRSKKTLVYNSGDQTPKIVNVSARIAFLLSVNGRSVRQIYRLFKTIYHESHFYYIHVDSRQKYLKFQLENLEQLYPHNVKLSNISYATIWGGSELLDMHLHAMKDLLNLRYTTWKWDFILNLSETEFLIKSIYELTNFLSKHRAKNFLKFYNNSIDNLIRKQGLNKTFLQCEDRMWRIGNRELLPGLQVDGGSDWFCLNYDFVNYLIMSNDTYLNDLKNFYKYTLLPSESFFHTVLMNSPYCRTHVNGNLRFVNWIRSRGCKCQYKHVVDWCGCSPNVFTFDDLDTIDTFKDKAIFFARKFDPLINQQVINSIDQSIYGLYTSDFESLHVYWHNEYHEMDEMPKSREHEIMYKFFVDSLVTKIKSYFIAYGSNNQICESFDYLHEVHLLFEADKFQGYVISLKPMEKNLTFEAFFEYKSDKKINLFDDNGRELTGSNYIELNTYFNFLARIQVSSNYDQKEYLFKNYGDILGQDSNPMVLLQLKELKTEYKIDFTWTNPENLIVKNSTLNLAANNNGQIIVHALYKESSHEDQIALVPGLWNIRIVFNENSSVSSTTLKYSFLVLPSKVDEFQVNKTALNALVNRFWSFEEFCVHSEASYEIFNGIIKNCKESYWSTKYADPKSNLMLNLNDKRKKKF